MPISDSRLTQMALDALEEAAVEARQGPVRRTWPLRLALAFLASRKRHGGAIPRWPFDTYWRHLADTRENDRWANVNAALNAIYLAIGEMRDLERVSMFERKADEDL